MNFCNSASEYYSMIRLRFSHLAEVEHIAASPMYGILQNCGATESVYLEILGGRHFEVKFSENSLDGFSSGCVDLLCGTMKVETTDVEFLCVYMFGGFADIMALWNLRKLWINLRVTPKSFDQIGQSLPISLKSFQEITWKA